MVKYSILCIPYDDEWGDPKADEANAKLIGQAPELLRILREILETNADAKNFADLCADAWEVVIKASGVK